MSFSFNIAWSYGIRLFLGYDHLFLLSDTSQPLAFTSSAPLSSRSILNKRNVFSSASVKLSYAITMC
jgi:hypothetical protein